MGEEEEDKGFHAQVQRYFIETNFGAIDVCKDFCLQDSQCKSINYQRRTEKCEKFAVDSSEQTLEDIPSGVTQVYVGKVCTYSECKYL